MPVLSVVLGCGSVEPVQDQFTLALGAPGVFIRRGETQMVTVTVARASGDTPIDVALDGLPAGVTFDPLQIAGASGSITLHASATADEGVAMVGVHGSAGDASADANLRLLVGDVPGSLDLSFGDGGKVVTTLTGVALVGRGIALGAGGVLATGVNTGQGQAVTIKLDHRGQPDPAFGSGGIVSTGVGAFSEGLAIAVTASNIIVAGVANGNATNDDDFGLFGYTLAGALDTTFGASGVTTINPSNGAFAEYHTVVAAPDGTIFAAGPIFPIMGAVSSRAHRFSSTGAVDNTFVVDEPNAVAHSALLQADGKLVLGGVSATDMWLARYNPDGSRDLGFGANGVVTTSFAPDAVDRNGFGLVAVAAGKLVAVATTTGTAGGTAPRIIIARYNANGSLDLTFGVGGKITTNVPFQSRSLGAALIDADNRLVTVGITNGLPSVARINADGSPDATFGANGVAVIDFGIAGSNEKSGAYGIVADADGRLLFTGEIGPGGGQRMIVARLWP